MPLCRQIVTRTTQDTKLAFKVCIKFCDLDSLVWNLNGTAALRVGQGPGGRS